MNSRTRNFVFTLNNPTDGLRQALKEKNFSYLCWGEEVGSQGTPHLQGVFVTKNAHTLTAMIQSLGMPMIHIEIMRGTPTQAIQYCQKDGNFFETGTRPLNQAQKGAKGGAKEKKRWAVTLEHAKKGRFDDIDPQLQITQFNNLQRVRHRFLKQRELPEMESKVLWCYGKTGTGKSRAARAAFPEAYLKICTNKWWCDYEGQDYVLMEDIDREHAYQAHNCKIWFDRYKFPAEFKGGFTEIRPLLICVTSNYHPSEIWTHASDLDPIMRRVHLLEFKEGEPKPMLECYRLSTPEEDTLKLEQEMINLISDDDDVVDLMSEDEVPKYEWEQSSSSISEDNSEGFPWEESEEEDSFF